MVTLVGPGGTGKTSLAAALGVQLLSSFPDGVFFVDLSALNDPALVMPALAQTLALKETPGRTLQHILADHLASKEMLLILDNFEQVIEAAPEVSALLTEAPDLKVAVTSREALRIQGERVFSLAPLELPSPDHDLDEVAGSTAVALFTERARSVKQDFALTQDNAADIAAICRRDISKVDRLPRSIDQGEQPGNEAERSPHEPLTRPNLAPLYPGYLYLMIRFMGMSAQSRGSSLDWDTPSPIFPVQLPWDAAYPRGEESTAKSVWTFWLSRAFDGHDQNRGRQNE